MTGREPMTGLHIVAVAPPSPDDRRLGACCTLDDAQLRERLRQWGALRSRSRAVKTPEGARLLLGPDEDLAAVADLAAAEAACCPFYSFTLSIEGAERVFVIDAGAEGGAAVHALLGLDEGA